MDPLIPRAIGWWGKLPSRGDFVGRGLPRAFQREWDDWLQRGLASAARQFGPVVLRERLAAMPPWHAVVLPRAPGEMAWCGVVVASSDRVGRVFPLLLAEAHDPADLGRRPFSALRERLQQMTEWLAEARPQATPKDLDQAAGEWIATPWRLAAEADIDAGPPAEPTPDAAADTAPNCLDDWRRAWPAAASFWWPAAPAGAASGTRIEAWPPREALLSDWLR